MSIKPSKVQCSKQVATNAPRIPCSRSKRIELWLWFRKKPGNQEKSPSSLGLKEFRGKDNRDNKTAIELFLRGVRALALQSSIIDVVQMFSGFSSAMGGH